MKLMRRGLVGKSEAGFSLIEMLTVVAIIGILSAVAIPNIIAYLRTYQLRASAQEVAQQLSNARTKAITTNVNLGVIWLPPSSSTSGWVIEDDLQPATPPAWSTIPQEKGGSWAALLADPVQARPFVTLRPNITFVDPANCVGGAAATDWGVRFGRLGSVCAVNATNASSCGAVPPAVTAYTNLIYVNAAGTAMLCLKSSLTNQSRWIQVTSGGRVTTQN